MKMYDDIDRLAELHMEMWWLDDEKNYPRLREVSRELFMLEGFDEEMSERASVLVTEAYREYKIAKENRSNEEVRGGHMEKTERALIDTYNALGRDSRDGILHYKWWRNFFSKRYYPIPLILFRQHLVKFKGRPLTALVCTLYLTLAGYIGHDSRDKQKTINYLKKYWNTVTNSGRRVVMF